MINDEKRVIICSIVGGLFMWVADALMDSLFFSKGTVWGSLLPGETHEVYFRSLFLVSFIILGIVMSRMVLRRRKAEDAMLLSEDKYRSVVESVGDSIYLVDRDYSYLFMNNLHKARLGSKGDDYRGKAYNELHSPEETKEFIEHVDKVFETGESVKHEHLSRRDNKYFLRTLSPVNDKDGTIIAVTVVSKDITELKQMEGKLRSLSFTDELTGLYNRRGFFTLVEQVLKLAKREKKGFFMLYADLDNLKEINDTWGHQEGDLALEDISKIFRASYRESDIIARIGGDEFVVVPCGESVSNMKMITTRFQKNIDEHNEREGRKYKLSVSFGMAYQNSESQYSADELLREAEKLMYVQKALKRNP